MPAKSFPLVTHQARLLHFETIHFCYFIPFFISYFSLKLLSHFDLVGKYTFLIRGLLELCHILIKLVWSFICFDGINVRGLNSKMFCFKNLVINVVGCINQRMTFYLLLLGEINHLFSMVTL